MKPARLYLVLATLLLGIGIAAHRHSRRETASPHVMLHDFQRASSGTFVESNLILSCAHGKTLDQRLTLVLADGRRGNGTVAWISPSKDLSLIETRKAPSVRPRAIADRAHPWPAVVQLFGFGGTGRLHEYQAIVLKRAHISHTWGDGSPNPNWNSYLLLSGFSQRGDSGGAAVADGRIVGVIVGTSHLKASDGSTSYYTDCVPVEVIRDFLDEWRTHLKSTPSSQAN